MNWLVAVIQLMFGDVNNRLLVVKSLTASTGPGAWGLLNRAVRDRDARVRQAAITALGSKFGAKAIGILITALQHDENEDIRMKAADLLVQIGQEAVTPLINALIKAFAPLINVSITSQTIIDPALPAQTLVRIGGQQVVSSLITLLEEREPIIDRTLAAQVLGKIPQAISFLTTLINDKSGRRRDAAIEALVAVLQYIPDESIRMSATDMLVQMGQDAVLPLIEVLRSKDPSARADAADLLVRIGEDAASPLIDVLRSDDPSLRELAVQALVRIGGPLTVSSLMTFINDKPSRGRDAVIRSLVEILQFDKDKNIRMKAADLLVQMGQDAVLPLIDVLRSKDPITSAAAADLLMLIGEAAISPLIDVLRSKDPITSAAAADLLVRIGKDAISPLTDALTSRDSADLPDLNADPDFEMRVVDLLAQIGQDAVAPLIDVLRSNNWWGTHYASIALGRIGGPETVSSLMAAVKDLTGWARSAAISSLVDVLLQDKDKSTRIDAADLLVQIGQDAVLSLHSALLRQSITDPVVLATQTLGRIGGPEAVSHLINLLKDTREPVSQAAAEALRSIGGRLKSEIAMERLAAVRALEVVGGSEAVESLVQTLEDEDPEVSWEAALALEKNPNQNAIRKRVSYLEQAKGNIPGVAYLLAQFGGSEVRDRLQKRIPSIVRHLKGENPIQRLAAVKALDVIGGPEAIEAIVEILNDPDDRVSYAIAKALARRGDSTTIQAKLSAWKFSDLGKKYGDNEAVDTLVAASAALNSNELRRYTEGKSEETHKNIRAQLEKQLNKLLDRYAPDTFGG